MWGAPVALPGTQQPSQDFTQLGLGPSGHREDRGQLVRSSSAPTLAFPHGWSGEVQTLTPAQDQGGQWGGRGDGCAAWQGMAVHRTSSF